MCQSPTVPSPAPHGLVLNSLSVLHIEDKFTTLNIQKHISRIHVDYFSLCVCVCVKAMMPQIMNTTTGWFLMELNTEKSLMSRYVILVYTFSFPANNSIPNVINVNLNTDFTVNWLLNIFRTTPLPNISMVEENYHTTMSSEISIKTVSFPFDLMRLLPKCQQVELLFSTYIQQG